METLAEQIYSFENLEQAYLEVARGKRHKKEFQEFRLNLEENLINMQNELIYRSYVPGDTVTFNIREPKLRSITRPKIYDRVVHHALVRVTLPYFEKHFHPSSFACRAGKEYILVKVVDKDGKEHTIDYHLSSNTSRSYPKSYPHYKAKKYAETDASSLFPGATYVHATLHEGKGQAAGCRHYQDLLRRAIGKYGTVTVIAIDIKGFFKSINHKALKMLIKRLFYFDDFVIWLYCTIIDSIDEGLPIGFLPSQHEANLTGGVIDYFITDVLKQKYYIRYMDDIRILCRSREEAKEILSATDELVINKLGLRLSENKTRIFTFHRYDTFCGYQVHPHYLAPKPATIKRAHKRLRKKKDLLDKGMISKEHFIESVYSLLAYLEYTTTPIDLLAEEYLRNIKQGV